MKPDNHEEHKQHTFDSFCKKVLKNEVRDYYDEMKRQAEREVSFSELSAREMNMLFVLDDYSTDCVNFNVFGYNISVNELVAEAIAALPEQKRDIILLFYFLDMTDGEIGEMLHLVRRTVQHKRKSSLRELKKFMEVNTDE